MISKKVRQQQREDYIALMGASLARKDCNSTAQRSYRFGISVAYDKANRRALGHPVFANAETPEFLADQAREFRVLTDEERKGWGE